MKRLKAIFCKKQPVATERPIIGITDAEYLRITDALRAEYSMAGTRQKPGTVEPSRYMDGLNKALEIISSVEPHILGGN